MNHCLLLVLVSLLLTGCVNLKPAKVPLDRYALGLSGLAEVTEAGAGRKLYIEQPNVPVYLEADRMYVRGANGEISQAGGVRWAEPLDEGLARSLAEYIELKSAHRVYAYYPWRTKETELCAVKLNVYKLIAGENGQLLVDIGWRMDCPDTESRYGRYRHVFEWAPDEITSYVTAVNEAIEGLADQLIATGLE